LLNQFTPLIVSGMVWRTCLSLAQRL